MPQNSELKHNKIYQTIIIGAGPAGLIAGKYLENALILDKKKEIGKPIQCGEGISKKALERQGIKPDVSWVSSEIYKIERIMPNGKAIGKLYDEPIGYVIDREKFEKYLAGNVKAEIKLNTEIEDLRLVGEYWEVAAKNGMVFKSKYVIGADGPLSIVRRKVFPENQEKMEFVPAIEYLVRTEKEFDTKIMKIFFDNEKYDQGYAWIFPKSKNTANIGIGGKGYLFKKFNDFLEKTIKLHYGNFNLLENKSGLVSFLNSAVRIFKNNIFLVGDAAGLADPIFKGGMSQAMCSANIAAQCILENKTYLYQVKISSMPFLNPKLIKASKIFFNSENQTLNNLSEVLERKNVFFLTNIKFIINFIFNPVLRKNFLKIANSFLIWKKNQDHLW